MWWVDAQCSGWNTLQQQQHDPEFGTRFSHTFRLNTFLANSAKENKKKEQKMKKEAEKKAKKEKQA